MKRRLTRAFDRMTMPQDCSDRIQKLLEAELEADAAMTGKGRGTREKLVHQRVQREPLWKSVSAVAASLVLLVGLGFVGYRHILMQKVAVQPVATASAETEAPVNTENTQTNRQKLIWSGDFAYCENEDGSLTLAKYVGAEEDIDLLPFVEGKPVTVIGNTFWDPENGEGAFAGCETIKSVTIPDSVTLLDDNAFQSCPNLETVYIPASVTAIGNCVFENCGALQSVYFAGDAPAAGNYVFTNAESAIVYYLEGTSGWEDTWEGRPARLLVTQETGEALDQLRKESRVAFIGILMEGHVFQDPESGEALSLNDYCEAYAQNCGAETAFTRFAVVDLDGDGVEEVVLKLEVLGNPQGSLILRYQEGSVYGNLLYEREMFDLKEDGTFSISVSSSPSNAGRLVFMGEYPGTQVLKGTRQEQQEKNDARWFTYPCRRADAVLASSQSANGAGDPEGAYNYYFELFRDLVLGSHTSSWELLCAMMDEKGYDWQVSEGILRVYFPDAPGCMLTAYPSGEAVGELSYYACTEEREIEVTVTDLDTAQPRYFVGASGPDTGTEVALLEDMDDYVRQNTLENQDELEHLAALTTVEQFSNAYLTADTVAMKEYLLDDYKKRLETYSGSPDYQVESIKGIPEETADVGTEVTAWVEFRETPEADSYTYLTIELVRQTFGWKVQSYALEK